MNKAFILAASMLLLFSCNEMNTNPLLSESTLPYGAPQFDKIKTSDYMPAFKKAIQEGKAEIDAIVANPEDPDFENTIEALEFSGRSFNNVASIFYNLMEADTNEEMQQIAEELAPLTNEYSMYISLNEPLFQRVKTVWEQKDSLKLDIDQRKLLEETYKSFARNGANLSAEDKKTYEELQNKVSLATLQFSKNLLASTNAFYMQLSDEAELEGLPSFVKEQGAEAAKAKGLEGWVYDLSAPSYSAFCKYSSRRDLREKMYRAYNTRAIGGDTDNCDVVREIVDLRTKIAQLLGYPSYADYALEDRMAKTPQTVTDFLGKLMEPSLPKARAEVKEIYDYAVANGFEGDELMPWDFSFWSDKYMTAKYSINDEQLKPYFQLENCIDAAFDLAHRLYGITFEKRDDIPGYNPDVKVFDVKDEDGKHLALFYADFFPRASKRSGAWMTSFREQSIVNGEEFRPFISIVTNFTKPAGDAPSLLTHDEFTTFLHEFGHSIHGMLAEGRYPSLTGTNVARDFVELPSQIMENWAFEPDYLNTFAKHYQTGELLPGELIDKLVASKNYLAAYYQVRQLHFGILDMAWYYRENLPEQGSIEFEKSVLEPYSVIYSVPGCAISPSFSHIFSGGYSAGYYSYKWAEVLEADAFSLFSEKGIFNREVSDSFRKNILSRGSTEDESVLYRNFRGHDPEPEALLRKLGIIE